LFILVEGLNSLYIISYLHETIIGAVNPVKSGGSKVGRDLCSGQNGTYPWTSHNNISERVSMIEDNIINTLE